MKFVLLKPWNGDPEGVWWNWNVEKMKLLNFRGGGFDIDENADYWLNAEVHEFDSWAALYHATGFNPLEEDIHAYDVWISPEGIYFDGDAHAVAAEGICKLVYDRDYDDDIIGTLSITTCLPFFIASVATLAPTSGTPVQSTTA